MTSQHIKLIAQSAMAALIVVMLLDRPGPAQGAAVEKTGLPAYKGTLRDDYYPADARQHFLQGRAMVEFTLNGSGVPADVVVVASEPPREFEKSARLLVKNLRFEIPAGWERSATAGQRFRIGVRFQVVDCINLSHCESQARNPPADYSEADRTYIVTAERRVLTFSNRAPAEPAAPGQPQYGQPAAPAPGYPQPRPQYVPPTSGEPIYPPG